MFFFAFVRTPVATMKTNRAPRQPSRGTPREARVLLCSTPPWALEDRQVSGDMLGTELVTDTYSVQVQNFPRRKQGKWNATSTDFCSKTFAMSTTHSREKCTSRKGQPIDHQTLNVSVLETREHWRDAQCVECTVVATDRDRKA